MVDSDEGIFFMSFEDFEKYFADCDICRYYENYKTTSYKTTCETDHTVYFKMSVSTPGVYYISVH